MRTRTGGPDLSIPTSCANFGGFLSLYTIATEGGEWGPLVCIFEEGGAIATDSNTPVSVSAFVVKRGPEGGYSFSLPPFLGLKWGKLIHTNLIARQARQLGLTTLRKISQAQKKLDKEKEALIKVQVKRKDALKLSRLKNQREASTRVIELEQKKIETAQQAQEALKADETTKNRETLINALSDWKSRVKDDNGTKVLSVRRLSTMHGCSKSTLHE